MAQQNHNINYMFTVDGITVWERLRVTRNFLQDREIALAIVNLPVELNTDREKLEYKIFEPQRLQNIKNAEDEIVFLLKLEAVLSSEAENTRIPGKTDDEMYEINYTEELIQRHLLTMKSQLLTTGAIDPSMMKTLLKHPMSAERAVEEKLIRPEILGMEKTELELIMSKNYGSKLLIEN